MSNEAPERIWADVKDGSWFSRNAEDDAGAVHDPDEVLYIRADLARVDPPAAPGDLISRSAAQAAVCSRCANPERYGPAIPIEGSQRLFHFQIADNWNAGQCSAQTIIELSGTAPAAPEERDKQLAQEFITRWLGRFDARYISVSKTTELLTEFAATVRAEEERNFVNNVAAVLDADDVDLFTALIMKAKASPDLRSTTRSALKSEAEIRVEEREAAFTDGIALIEKLICPAQFEGNWRNGYSHAQNDAFRALESARTGKVEGNV